MGFTLKIPAALSTFSILFCVVSSTPISSEPQFYASLDNFSRNIFDEIFITKGDENIIFSPFSIQTCLAMTRLGADGETADEMTQQLGFSGQTAESLAENYYSLLAKYEKSNILQFANKIYLANGLELQESYNDIISKKFLSSAENIDFTQSDKAAANINTWIASKTNNLIKDLVEPKTLSKDTLMLLLSAIHFKGNWETPFSPELTNEANFYTDETNSVKVEMMYKPGRADYGQLKDLQASAVRLHYKNSDLSMLIILPNSRTGLAALEDKLKNIPLESLTKKISSNVRVEVYLPKFKAELEIQLKDILQKMGMTKMFGAADFSKMFKSTASGISEIMHKAIIEVNEMGTEAAAVTVSRMTLSAVEFFYADHPFHYVIINENSVPLFQGTYVGK